MASKMDNFTKEQLQEIVNTCTSMRELARKCGYVSIGNNDKTIKTKLAEYGISIEHFDGSSQGHSIRTEENVFCENSTAGQSVLRRWYTKGEYSVYECSICGQQPIWNNQPLILTLDHINGNNHDNRLENLRWVCPNCDRQLPTYGNKNHSDRTELIVDNAGQISSSSSTQGLNELIKMKPRTHDVDICTECGKYISKNTKTHLCSDCYARSIRKTERPSRNELKQLIRTTPFVKIAEQYGVSDKSIVKWCISENLPSKKKDIKQYNDDEWEKL